MIKITKPGNQPISKDVIYQEICFECGCEFECEIEDFTKIERSPDGYAYINCPCCGKEVRSLRNCYRSK